MRSRVLQNILVAMSQTVLMANLNAQEGLPVSPTTIAVRTPVAATAITPVPSLVPYSGAALGSNGKPLTGELSATFLIYKDQQGGEPLLTETQMVRLDEA